MSEKLTIVNEKSYAPVGQPTFRKTFTLTVEAILDGVPGAFNQEEDLMRWINGNPYVRCVTLEGEAV